MRTVNVREVPLSAIIDLPVHPAADCFPMLEKNASKREEGKTKTITLSELADSINEFGLQEPIVLFDSEDGKFLLDGRNRRAACKMAAQVSGDTPDEYMVTVEDFIGTNDEAKEYVKALNLDRRDLEPTQRAVSALKWWDMEAAEAKLRKRATQNNKAAEALRADKPNLADQVGATAEILASDFRVSAGYIKDARRIERERQQAAEAAERAAQRAEEYEQAEEEAKAELQEAVAVDNKEKAREASAKVNNATNHKTEEREKAAALAEEARSKAALIERLHSGDKKLAEVRKEQKDSGKDDRELAITKAATQFNDGYNKVIENGIFLLREGRDNDQENVRLKYSHIVEKFDSVGEIDLQTQHYFPTEREPSDEASRWAGEVRIRLAGVAKIITEKGVTPSMVTKNVEFLKTIDLLEGFLAEVRDSLNDES